jgi:hypothetical protein
MRLSFRSGAGDGGRHEPVFDGWAARGTSSQRPAAAAASVPISPDIAFLVRHGVPRRILRLAANLAAHRRSDARQELFAFGFDRRRYWAALASELGVPCRSDLSGAELLAHAYVPSAIAVGRAASALVRVDGQAALAVAPHGAELALLAGRLEHVPGLARRLLIVPPEAIRAFLAARRHRSLAHYAVNRLATVLPQLSAQRTGDHVGGPTASLVAAIFACVLLAPVESLLFLGLLLSAFFTNCGIWRMAAALHHSETPKLEVLASARLPTYTVLVPLYREAVVVPDLLATLAALDYPQSKLQILIILEADDRACREAVAAHVASPLVEVLVVPPGEPRTKPKALTYALAFARGEHVVVFDAEDRPEPDQLRRAAAAFAARPGLGCVQARLFPDNRDSWFARMFALEYAANFEVVLPALAAFRVPLPLGGTSNHFPRAVLEEVCAWDPFNVTEDADLGLRLARFGYRTATIVSHTYEEAPVRFRQWLPQRRRWIKGWMQTVLACVGGRAPASLRLPLRQQLAVHGILTAGVVGLLLYPVSLFIAAATSLALLRGDLPDGPWGWAFLLVNVGNLGLVLAAAGVSTWRGLKLAGARRLAWLIPLLPLYWAVMSLAAWQAVGQLLRAPSRWEKTEHGLGARPPRRVGSFARLRPQTAGHAPAPLVQPGLQDVREFDDAGKDRPVGRARRRLWGERQAG